MIWKYIKVQFQVEVIFQQWTKFFIALTKIDCAFHVQMNIWNLCDWMFQINRQKKSKPLIVYFTIFCIDR